MLGDGEPAAGPWHVETVEEFARQLLGSAGSPAGRPAVVAVDGRSGSGKTTLLERIRAAVPASAVVCTDDVAWNHSMFGWADLLADGILRAVHRGEPVSFRPPAWRERSRKGAIEVPAGCEMVIVEGVGAARRHAAAPARPGYSGSHRWPCSRPRSAIVSQDRSSGGRISDRQDLGICLVGRRKRPCELSQLPGAPEQHSQPGCTQRPPPGPYLPHHPGMRVVNAQAGVVQKAAAQTVPPAVPAMADDGHAAILQRAGMLT